MSPEAAVESPLQWIRDGHLLSVPGVEGAAVACGLKEGDTFDLALLRCRASWTAAGVFTRNALPAAPVVLCRETLARDDEVRTVVMNAGNANAMTGDRGMADARTMADRVGDRCGGPALVLSTGVIGVPLPIDRVLEGIDDASGRLGGNGNAGGRTERSEQPVRSRQVLPQGFRPRR